MITNTMYRLDNIKFLFYNLSKKPLFGLTYLNLAIAWLFQSSKSNILLLMSLTLPEPHQFSTTLMAVFSLAVLIPDTNS